jgi:hypothetical protein
MVFETEADETNKSIEINKWLRNGVKLRILLMVAQASPGSSNHQETIATN